MADARVMKERQDETEVNEAQIAVHWKEEQYYYPSAAFIGQANLSDPAINERFSEKNFPECFKEYGDLLSWDEYWHTTLDTSNAPFWKWFVGGKLNACYNCVDRHLSTDRNKAALIWVPEPESDDPVAITYQELRSEVVRRRQAERLLQLRRPAPVHRPQQGRADLGSRARVRRPGGHHVSGAQIGSGSSAAS